MAKRRRLDPARQNGPASAAPAVPNPAATAVSNPAGAAVSTPAARPAGLAPIARVAGEAAASAALDELSQSLRAARDEGRLALDLPIAAIEAGHLERDRLATETGSEIETEALEALEASLAARGQQVPIEVEPLPPGPDGAERYGLISGWRRLTALGRLHDRGAGPGTVLAVLRRPEDAAAAYVAMVEENEIRADLSHWERGRILHRAVADGAFADTAEALRRLFAASPYARRSKIRSFAALVAALDGALRFPTALSERLGLALARAIEADPDLAPRIRRDLAARPAEDAAQEAARLAEFATPPRAPEPVPLAEAGSEASSDPGPAPAKADPAPGKSPPPPARPPAISMMVGQGEVRLIGPDLTPDLVARLRAWLGLPK